MFFLSFIINFRLRIVYKTNDSLKSNVVLLIIKSFYFLQPLEI